MTKLRKIIFCVMAVTTLALCVPATLPQPFQVGTVAEAATYDDVKSKVSSFTDGAKRFWDDSAPDRAKLSKKAKKKWKALQKKIKAEYKKAKKKGKKGLNKFKKWRKKQEKEFWSWYQHQMSGK